MKGSPTASIGTRSDKQTERTIAASDEVEALLGALEDEDCRAILRATTHESLSASELAEVCEMPLSTTYRKVDELTDAGLLDEQIRLSQSGKHTSEYALSAEDIHVTVDADSGVTLRVLERERSDGVASMLASAD